MVIYIFDGSFDGFLTCIYESYYNELKPSNIVDKADYSPNLIDTVVDVHTNSENFLKVYSAMEEKFTEITLKNIMNVFLSNYTDKYKLLLDYIKLAFKFKENVDMYLNNDIILLIAKISKAVKLEAHRFTGFVRFKEFDTNSYYAQIEPDNDILMLLISHFTSRFKNQKFIIHDIKRQKALIYDEKDYFISDFNNDYYKDLDCINDCFYEKLWQGYYNSASINSRKNSKLQCRQMPKRYWKHLIETK